MTESETIPSKELEKPRYDAIFVLPAYPFPQEKLSFSLEGVVERIAGLPKISHQSGLLFDTRLRVDAAVLMAEKGDSPKVVTMTRKIRGWMDESYATLMEKQVKSLMGEKIEVLKEEESYDLKSGLEQVKKIAQKRDLNRVAIITDSVQTKRVEELISKNPEFPEHQVISMEEILTDEYSAGTKVGQFRRIIEKLHTSSYWTFWKIRERIARSNPSIANKISQITRWV